MKSLVLHFFLTLLALLVLMPLLWLICAAFKPQQDLFTSLLIPWNHLRGLTVDNFIELNRRQPLARWLVNSIFLCTASTALSVTLSSLGGFALAKYRFRGKRTIMFILVATMLLPSQVVLPSLYEEMYRLGWLDTYLAIIVPASVSVFGTFLFRQAMLQVPDELLQCGRLDGCAEWRLWWDIALPIVRPMIGAYTLMSFLANWNSFIWPQIVLQSEAKYTLPIALNNLNILPEFQTDYGLLMAGTLISILPVVILFFALQRDFISGLASGALKG